MKSILTFGLLAAAAALLGCGQVQVISKLSSGVDSAASAKPAKPASGLFPVKNAPRPLPPKTEIARFAAGCFWGVEDYMRKEPGVIATAVGFSGGHVANASYYRVCQGDTGHAESVEIEFDPTKTSYEKLVRLFFEIHNPTEVNRQGPDVGEQYRSAIFYRNPEQKKVAEQTMASLQKSDEFKDDKIATELTPAGPFYFAEDYHQQYIEKGGRAYCHARKARDFGK